MVNLVAMKIKDFQSWVNGTIEFAPGLNVIKGENNHGKSAIFNAFMITCNPNKFSASERKDFIRHKKPYAEISYIFEGFQACVVRLLPTRIIYLYSDDFRSIPYKQSEGKPPKELLELLEVYVEPTTGFLLNIIDSDRQLLLVNSDEKADSQLITALVQNPELTRLIKLFESKLPDLEAYRASLLSSEYRLEASLSKLEYTDIDEMENDIKQADLIMDVFPKLIRIYDYIKDLQFMSEDLIKLNELLEEVDLLLALESSPILSIDYNTTEFNLSDLEMCNLGISLEDTGILNVAIPEDGNNIKALETILDVTDNLIDTYNRVSYIENIIRSNKDLLDNNITPLIELDESIKPLIELNNILTNADKMINENNIILDEINGLESILNDLVNENEVIDCPIHDKIVFKDRQCIPIMS